MASGDSFQHPAVISNRPGLDTIRYRAGDFISFREALLRPLSSERELRQWCPGAQGDLAVQILEWWAYLADILTFYNERIANQAYLRTANLPESVQRLIRILGYRPRPGIGAQGQVAALVGAATSITIPQGFQIQSKPGPGQQPQTFEVDTATEVGPSDAVYADLPADETIGTSVLLEGVVTGIQTGDRLLLLKRGWAGETDGYALVTVGSSAEKKDPRGKKNTLVTFKAAPSLPSDAQATDYRLLRSGQSIGLWPYDADDVVTTTQANLASLARQIQVGDPVLFETTGVAMVAQLVNVASFEAIAGGVKAASGAATAAQLVNVAAFEAIAAGVKAGSGAATAAQLVNVASFEAIAAGVKAKSGAAAATELADIASFEEIAAGVKVKSGAATATQLASVTSYQEIVWFANPADPATPKVGPDPADAVPIPIPHTCIGCTPTLLTSFDSSRSTTQVRFAWQDVGRVIATPATSTSESSVTLTAVSPAEVPSVSLGDTVVLEDANSQGATGQAAEGATSTTLTVSGIPTLSSPLAAPLRALFSLLPVSRGKTVASETLGSGDATVAGQEFTLKKSPLTYLAASDSTSEESYQSTLSVYVDGVEWTEVASFYGQSADARVFITREDEDDETHVQFGDGVNGARLPSGVDNVTATYRYESGEEAPEAGKLNVIVKPLTGLKSIVSPVAPEGGADPDPSDRIRELAPRSVLTFNRAVSADDYEAVAAQTPGVTRAQACWSFDTSSQRMLVNVYVGDTQGAVTAARTALARAADPNRPALVTQAKPTSIALRLTLRLAQGYLSDPVIAAVTAALLDDDDGLFGVNAVRIGQVVYNSQIYAACLGTAGVLAVHGLAFYRKSKRGVWGFESGSRHSAGEGRFYQLASELLVLKVEASQDGV